MKLTKTIIVAVSFAAVSVMLAQNTTALNMALVMTNRQFTGSGIQSLTPAQRAVLDDWLNSYTRQVVSISMGASGSGNYSGTGKHWVDEVCKDGAIVVLEDDSMWLIEDSDRVDTGLWLTTTDITVKASPRAVGDYKYILKNTEDNETAHAKYLGSL